MSFASDVKGELCRSPLSRSCCALAESCGVLLFCHTFSPAEIRIITANPAFAARLPKLFRRCFDLSFDVLPPENAAGKRSFIITDPAKIERVFAAFDQEPGIALHVNFGLLENDCCRCAFLRGAFLAGGSVTDPSKGFHLELGTVHQSVFRELPALLRELEFVPGESHRGGTRLLYFKNSDVISDFLTTMGASRAAMTVMQAKVEKEMSNAINRQVNCDSANADKIVSAAQEQLEAIRETDLSLLPDVLRETAMLRIANPEASLADLARLAMPPVSKSCMSHRMKKLMSYRGK